MACQNEVRYTAPLLPPEEGLPNWMTRINVAMIPTGPRTRRRTAAKSATTRMMNARIGQTIQNDDEGSPSSQVVAIRSRTRPVASANPASHSPRQRADAEPVAVASSAAAM